MKEEIIFYQLYAEYFTKKNAFSASMKKITSDIIDGTHVAIIRPNVHERQYYNTKVSFSSVENYDDHNLNTIEGRYTTLLYA
ncbi:jg17177 [Pararge aegeria aegeria]|uniref:Jg17177 protein n=1 Tax=Pararge aegeria aegeria TaxID=348720 RepID=A0A8S4QIJ6_9NEOP|nr:jg17177 [Pararge aegeria aegeria]